MNCETCSEYLADFLLDELPESRAVLVQEHLNLCAACMRNYKELKGTGKALEAVPELRPVEGSPEFEAEVRKQAAVELVKIVERLPPEKRLRLEARRAARQSQSYRPPARRKPFWSSPLILLALLGLVVVLLFVFASRQTRPEARVMGRLSLTMGQVEMFFQRPNHPHTPAAEGKEVLSGDIYLTRENAGARFDLLDGGALFLAPSSGLTFRAPVEGTRIPVLVLDAGQLGVQRNFLGAGPVGDTPGEPWDLRTGTSSVVVSRNAHAYLSAPNAEFPGGRLVVLSGSAEILNLNGDRVASVSAGQALVLPSDKNSNPRPEALTERRVPRWRADLLTDAELSHLFAGTPKIGGRNQTGVEVLLTYQPKDLRRNLTDWAGENGEGLQLSSGGAMILPERLRLQHDAPFVAPLMLELTFDRASSGDASLAFGALETGLGGVSVDIARDGTLQVHERGRTTRSAAIPVRTQPGGAERLRLDIVREKNAFTAVVSSLSSGQSTSVALPEECNEPGTVWLEGLGSGILLDEIRVSGTIPVDWLRDQLSKQ